MYESTHALGRSNRRQWLAVAAGLAAVLVVLLLIGVAYHARADRSDPVLGGLGSPEASPEPDAAEPDAPVQPGEQGGNGAPPPGPPPGPPPAPDPVPEPEPLAIEVLVFNPPLNNVCHATGRITVTGGDYDLEVTYQWFRGNVALPQQPLIPYGLPQQVTLSEPGTIDVQSPPFPENASQNRMQLRVVDPDGAASDIVTYPACTEAQIQF